jgi:ATP-dependent Clp protease ATP-binding subunit ClpC
VEILRGLRDRYESHHRVSITDGALDAAARLSDRYISDRQLPDKAIDLIDEAGSRLRIRRMTAPPDLREFDDRIAETRKEKESAIDAQDFEKAASLRDVEKNLLAEKAEREREWKAGDLDVVAEVDERLIGEVLALMTGIPVSDLTEDDIERLRRMEDELHKRVIGQEQAIKALSRAIRRTRAGLKDPKRPSGSFIFAGPSGVGKTELSKTLAEFLFGDEDALIALDMSEYSERHTASRLFGSPPGYVGYEEGGQLTEKVRRKPFSVVLFDEVEKAHPDVIQLLLQILEDGRLTDSLGRTVDFRNTIIIMTSNVGAQLLQRQTSMGFAAATSNFNDAEKMREKVLEEAKRVFKPEFLNRISDIIFFRPLDKNDLVKIVELETKHFAKRLDERKITLEFTQEAKDLLIEKGYDEKYGARPLRRAVEHYLEDPLAEALLRGDVKDGEPVVVARDGDKLIFKQKTPPTAPSGVTP